MYNVEYKSFNELLEIIPEVTHGYNCKKDIKYYSYYDVIIIYDANETVVGVFTDDYIFANTIRYFFEKPEKMQYIFTPSIRCVIIKHEQYRSIMLKELMKRYAIKI